MHEFLEEIEDERGYLYYLNPNSKVRYKENPKLILILNRLKSDFENIKFKSYKSVLKIIGLKKSFYTFCIPYLSVLKVIEKHRVNQSDGIRPNQLTAIIHDVFFAAEKAGFYLESNYKNFNLKSSVAVTCNFLWSVFDPKRTVSISIMELKLAMMILTELPTDNTYHAIIDEHFAVAKDHNNCITRNRFEVFINIVGKMLAILGEPLYFERMVVQEIIQESFAQYPGNIGMNQYQFMNLWTSHQNTKFSLYTNLFLLLIRFKKSEFVLHRNSQCAGCSTFPIAGLRFKCQKCKGMSLCFKCFSTGYQTRKHTLAHRMCEFSSNEVPKGRFQSFMLKICNVFKRQQSETTNNVVSVFDHDQQQQTESNSKLIENEHIELILIDDDMNERGTYAKRSIGRRRDTIRSEVFNNSENVMIMQRNLMEKILIIFDTMTLEADSFDRNIKMNERYLLTCGDDGSLLNDLIKHRQFLEEQTNNIKNFHEAMLSSLAIPTNNKTIKSGFISPTTSLFLPYSSTPYRQTTKNQLKDINTNTSGQLAKSINGAELNKTYLDMNKADYSVSDISTWFQTKMPNPSAPAHSTKDVVKKFDDVAFDTKVVNFRVLLMKVKEIIEDTYTDNTELATTTKCLEEALDKIIAEEEHKRQ